MSTADSMWRDGDYPDAWRDYDQASVRPSGTGSASLLGLTAEDGHEAEKRKVPIGFRSPEANDFEPWEELLQRVGTAKAHAQASVLEQHLVGLGECLWTARDLIRIETTSVGSRVVVEARCLTS